MDERNWRKFWSLKFDTDPAPWMFYVIYATAIALLAHELTI